MPERTRVLVLLKTLAVGGAEMLVLQSARLWDRERFDYRLGYLGGSRELEQSFADEGVTTVRFQKYANDPRAALSIARYLRENSIDLVHAHLPQPALTAHLARRGTRTRLVVTNHSDAVAMRPAMRTLARLAWPRADAVIAVGESVAADTRVGNCRMIPNGVDVSRFAHAAPAALDLPTGAQVVLVLANLHVRKRPLETLRVFERACGDLGDFGNAHLVYAGDGPLRLALKCEADASPIRERVHLLGERRDVPALVRRADIVLLLSRAEGLPMALLEAAAGGAALIATKVASVEALIHHGETGFLATHDDEAAAHLRTLLHDGDLRARLARNAQALVTKDFSLEANVRATEDLYLEVLGGTR